MVIQIGNLNQYLIWKLLVTNIIDMKKIILLLFMIASLNAVCQLTETTVLSNYPRHDTSVIVSMTAEYDWISFFTFTNADKKHDTVYVDILGKVAGGVTYALINSDTLIYSDTVAIIRPLYYTCETEYPKYEGIWNYLKFRVRTNATSDEKIYMYFRKLTR
jgi:hypothetical protein